MTLTQLFDVFYRRQRRVFIIVAVVVFVAATLVTLSLQKQYQGTATLFVGENRPLSAGATAVQLDDVLARTYAELLKTPTLQRQVAKAVDRSPTELDGIIGVEIVPGTRLLEISALDPEPRKAQELANVYAKTFVAAQQSSLSSSSQDRLDRLGRRIGQLATERGRLTGSASRRAGRLAQIDNELSALRQSFTATQESSALQGQNVSVSSLSVVPDVPAKPRRKLYLAMALVFALILGAAAALLRNAFDKRIRDEAELLAIFGDVPVLARIPVRRSNEDARALGEAFDFLRVNLRMQAADNPARTIAVTSSLPGDGKSTISTRLAQTFAQIGSSVVVADCDLRKPTLARYMGVSQPLGVTNVLVAGHPPRELLTDTGVPGLRVLSSGPIPPNPSVLLGLPRFGQLVDELRAEADYVVIDTPPVPAGVDTSAIAQVVDGVVLVVDLNRTNREALEATRDQLEQARARLLGVVLNRVPEYHGHYGYGYGYSATGTGSGSSESETTSPPPPRRRRRTADPA